VPLRFAVVFHPSSVEAPLKQLALLLHLTLRSSAAVVLLSFGSETLSLAPLEINNMAAAGGIPVDLRVVLSLSTMGIPPEAISFK
jgi:hypothetical protein